MSYIDVLKFLPQPGQQPAQPATPAPLDMEFAEARVSVLKGRLKRDWTNRLETPQERAEHRRKVESALSEARAFAETLTSKAATLGVDQQLEVARLVSSLAAATDQAEADLFSLG